MEYTHYDGKGFLIGYIPSRLVDLSMELFKNKSSRNTLLKMYSLILNKVETETRRRENRGWNKKRYYVTLSSTYFRKSIVDKYKPYINILVENGFVVIQNRELDFYELRDNGISLNLFDESIYIETYKVGSRSKGYSIVDYPTTSDKEYSFKLRMKENPFRTKNIKFLKSFGVKDIKITTDQYGYRLYHNLSNNYKKILPYDGSLIYYDLKSSIPFHVKYHLINEGYINDPFLELFVGDFYENWGKEIEVDITDRKKLKIKFNSYLNGKKGDFSPEINKRVKSKYPLFFSLKNKGLGRLMVKQETYLMLNKVVGTLPIDEVLCIHDGFIINKEYKDVVDTHVNSLECLKGFNLDVTKMEK